MFLEDDKVTDFPHPPYSPDLAPCHCFLIPRMKNEKDASW